MPHLEVSKPPESTTFCEKSVVPTLKRKGGFGESPFNGRKGVVVLRAWWTYRDDTQPYLLAVAEVMLFSCTYAKRLFHPVNKKS